MQFILTCATNESYFYLFWFFFQKRFIQRLILTFIHLSMISLAIYLRPADDLLKYKSAKDGVSYWKYISTTSNLSDLIAHKLM